MHDDKYPDFPVSLPFGFDTYFGEPKMPSDDPPEPALFLDPEEFLNPEL